MARHQLTTFFLDGLLFGIEIERVQEVIRAQELTRVPLAPRVIEGLINLRGQIVTAVDLRRRLDLTERPPGDSPMNVVLPSPGGAVSLLVDSVGEVVEVDDESFEAPPETLRGTARDMIRGAYKLPGALLLVLNVERVLNVTEEAGR
jgi:purine-binding chemotaxis protein CheW